MSFLNLEGKTILVTGVANKKSVAYHIGKTLEAEGAKVLYSIQSEDQRESVQKILGDVPIFLCDVEKDREVTGGL